MDEVQARRIARNEARFRSHNEHAQAAVATLHDGPVETCTVMCECALLDCEQMITMPVAAYERARADGSTFVVRPDHMIVSAERAIEHGDGWWIVEKIGPGGRIAEELDERPR